MNTTKMNPVLADLSNDQLIRKCDTAVRSEQELGIAILDYLNEIERRSLYLKEGYSSLFDYCTRRWRYSRSKAGRFIAAARCMNRFPAARILLSNREITVCGLSKISGLMSYETSDNLLREVSGKMYVEIEKIAASHRTAPVIRDFVRPIGFQAPGEDERGEEDQGDLFQVVSEMTPNRSQNGTGYPQVSTPATGEDRSQNRSNPKRKPAQRYEIRFSASEEFLEKLERARSICSKRWSLGAILEKGLDELLERHDPERKQARREKRESRKRVVAPDTQSVQTAPDGVGVKKGRAREEQIAAKQTRSPSTRSRYIPAPLRDAVFTRDNAQCTYVGGSGVRCGSTAHLQIDHINPFCMGGEHTLGNLRILCGKHNRLAARELSLAGR